jgi:hypothetical protein
MSLLLFLKILEYTSAIIATIKYKKFASRFTALFLFYLWFICVVETLSPLIRGSGFSNGSLFTIFTFFEFNILFLMYLSITKVKTTKQLLKLFILITNLVLFSEIYIQGIDQWPSVATVVGSILISIILILYLKEFLYSDKILNYSRSIYFWITLGSLVYYLGSIPFQAIINYLENRDLHFLQISLAIFAQSCVIIGFLWSKKETK